MSARWLFKTEPSDYSWDDLVRDKRTIWDGVGNNLALIHLREIRRGDKAFLYHTGSQRKILGIARVVKGSYPDPNRDDPKRVVVDVAPQEALDSPVSLAQVKDRKDLQDWDLVRNPRLSVMPVTDKQWQAVLEMSRA